VLRTRRPLLALLLLGVLLAGGYLLSFVGTDDPAPGTGAPTAATASPDGSGGPTGSGGSTATGPGGSSAAATRTPGATRPADGLRTVRAADLPPEAQQVMRLIDAGGPFRYDQDGSVFGNFERLLPAQARGWYREYTVPTPGERDRGARRIVAGRDGIRYYTADHYDSFTRITR
jgi:ribonuclease T1